MSWTAPTFDGSGSLRETAPAESWRAAAAEALARHALAGSAAGLFPTGSHVVVDCGPTVFRMTAPRWAGEIRAEHELLARVAGHLPRLLRAAGEPEPAGFEELALRLYGFD